MKINGKRPNFLIITTDEQRFPPPYENPEAKAYRLKNSECLAQMLSQGIEFTNHTAASTACAPSRTSIYTGQYPSLHGVSQTPGIGKSSFDQNMFWLETNTVPTMGSWFRKAGYQTFYRGKWHLSHEDIVK
jgi:arylsulfatase A-like enzyme